MCAVAHFLGGSSGEFIESQLAEAGIAQVTEWVEGATRTATTLLCGESGTATELVDPSPPIAPEEAENLKRKILADAAGMKAIGLCGTFPPGAL